MMTKIQGVLTIDLTDEDVEMLEAFHVADQTTRREALTFLRTRVRGINTADLIAFFNDWRAELDPDDIKLMRAALDELSQPEEEDSDAPPTSF